MTKIYPNMSVGDFIRSTVTELHLSPPKRIVTNILRVFYAHFCSNPEVNNDGDVTLAMALSVSDQELCKMPGWGAITDVWWSHILEHYGLRSGMKDYEIDLRLSELNDSHVPFTDGDDFPELTTDMCLRYLLSAGYMVSISPQPSSLRCD